MRRFYIKLFSCFWFESTESKILNNKTARGILKSLYRGIKSPGMPHDLNAKKIPRLRSPALQTYRLNRHFPWKACTASTPCWQANRACWSFSPCPCDGPCQECGQVLPKLHWPADCPLLAVISPLAPFRHMEHRNQIWSARSVIHPIDGRPFLHVIQRITLPLFHLVKPLPHFFISVLCFLFYK